MGGKAQNIAIHLGIAASLASHRLAADSTSVSRTRVTSSVKRLMTFSTSLVAVCCRRCFRQLPLECLDLVGKILFRSGGQHMR
jgi:hypothetical protein